MQSELCISRQIISKLREQIVSLERQCWSNCQYSRWECLELSGLPKLMDNLELEDKALKLFKKQDVEIDSSNIEDCHWLPSKTPKRVTVKFSNWKDASNIWKVKKNIQIMDLSSIVVVVYKSDSFCKHYKILWAKM